MSGQRVVLVEMQAWDDEEIYTILFLSEKPPMTVEDFQQVVQRFLPHLVLDETSPQLSRELSKIEGCVPGTECLVRNVDFVNQNDLPVLQFSEEGTPYLWDSVDEEDWADEDD